MLVPANGCSFAPFSTGKENMLKKSSSTNNVDWSGFIFVTYLSASVPDTGGFFYTDASAFTAAAAG